MLMCKTSFVWTRPFCFLPQKGEVPCFDRFLQLQHGSCRVAAMPWLVNSHPCDQKSPFRKGQMMDEPNRTEWIIQYLSSHWIFVTQGRHSYSATDTSALRDFLGCQKNHGPLISDHKFTRKQATSDTRFPMKCGAFVDYKTPLMTGSFVKFPMVLRLYPTRSISCAICTCIPSHPRNQWKKTLCFLSIYNKFRILLSDQSVPYRMPNTSDQSDSGFLRIYNLQNPLERSPSRLHEPPARFFLFSGEGFFRCKSSFRTKILIPFHWLAKRDSHTGIQSGEPTSLWPKQPPLVLVLLRCLANGL